MKAMSRVFCFGLLIIGSLSLAGCGGEPSTASNPSAESHGHDHEAHGDEHGHAHPQSFAEAVAEIDRLRAEIKTSFAAGDLAKADGPVHEIGHLLEELPQLAAKQSLSEAEQQEQVKQAVGSLMDSFAALDERVHGGDSAGKSYEEVAAQIDAAFAELNSVAKEKSP